MENHRGELWSLFHFLSPGLLHDEKTFRELYRTPIEKRGDPHRRAALAARVRPMSKEIHGATILATGCMFMIVGQAFINLAVAAGIFPVTGVPLPLVSYGFSSMLTMSVALGIIHSCIRAVREQLPEEATNPDLIPVPADD